MQEELIQKLTEQNRALRERIAQLEEKLGDDETKRVRDTKHMSRFMELLKHKDRTLGEYAIELEEKQKHLESVVELLEKKNSQLQTWVSALRLYQDIIENEAAALIGLNKDGRIVLYNLAATRMFGEDIRDKVGNSVNDIDFSEYDPYTLRLVDAVLKHPEMVDRKVEVGDRKIHTFVYPMGRGEDFRGVLLKILVAE